MQGVQCPCDDAVSCLQMLPFIFAAPACLPACWCFVCLQVNAAKRYNDARMRSSGSAGMVTTPRGLPAVAVPRLPLASLGRAGSAASSRQNSSRLSGRESDQRHWRPWQLQSSSPPRSPPVAGRRAAAAAPEEQAPLAREERARPAAAGTGTAVPPPSASKESRITLTELLSTTPGPSNRGPPSRSESRAAAGAASAEQGSLQGLRQSAVSLDCAPSPSASTSTAGGWKAAVAAAAEAAALREQQEAARQQAEAEEAVRASCVQLELAASGEPCLEQGLVPAPGADGSVHLAAGPAAAVDVVPGESAAPPIQDTPRDEAAAEEAPVQLPAGDFQASRLGGNACLDACCPMLPGCAWKPRLWAIKLPHVAPPCLPSSFQLQNVVWLLCGALAWRVIKLLPPGPFSITCRGARCGRQQPGSCRQASVATCYTTGARDSRCQAQTCTIRQRRQQRIPLS